MQVVTMHLTKSEFYCPFSGEVIFKNGEINDAAASFSGYWLDEFWEDPTIDDESIKEQWEKYLNALSRLDPLSRTSSPIVILEAFFNQCERQDFIVFKLIDELPKSPNLYVMLRV